MSYSRDDYVQESIEISLNDMGIPNALTRGQIEQLAGDVASGLEHMSTAYGHSVASANSTAARKDAEAKLEKELQRERDKVHCKQCNGSGRTVTSYGTRSGDSQCWKCHGEGRHDP